MDRLFECKVTFEPIPLFFRSNLFYIKPFNVMKKSTGTKPKFSTQPQLVAEPTFYDLLITALHEIYWAENHLVKVLPVMAEVATHPRLKEAITTHQGETLVQVERLEAVFAALSEKPLSKKCIAVEGLAKEGEAIIEMTGRSGPVTDMGIITACQKVEHYEIVSYESLINLAEGLGLNEVVEILKKTLDEEANSDEKLTAIALNEILPKGMKVS